MFERFTDRSRKVMALANQEAQRFNHEYIGTEHILLGLVKEGSGVAASVLKNLSVDLRMARLEVEKLIRPGPEMVTARKLPQTPRAKKVIEYAIEEARNLNHNYVGTEHLLLGLLREHDGTAAQVLMNLGLNLEQVREEVLNLLGASREQSEMSIDVKPTRVDADAELFESADDESPRVKKMSEDIERLSIQKDESIKAADYEHAAELRDQAIELSRQRDEIRREELAEERRQEGANPNIAALRKEIDRLRELERDAVRNRERKRVNELAILIAQNRKELQRMRKGITAPRPGLEGYCTQVHNEPNATTRNEVLDISAAVKQGDQVVLVGPPGSGRRTLLGLVAQTLSEFGPSASKWRVWLPDVDRIHTAYLRGDIELVFDWFRDHLLEAKFEVLALRAVELFASGRYPPPLSESWKNLIVEMHAHERPLICITEQSGWELLERQWPGITKSWKRIEIRPLAEGLLREIAVGRIETEAKMRGWKVVIKKNAIEQLMRKLDPRLMQHPGDAIRAADALIHYAGRSIAGKCEIDAATTDRVAKEFGNGR